MSVRFGFLLLALALSFGGSNLVAASAAWAQVRPGSLEEELFNSVRNKDLNGVRAALTAGANVFTTDMLGNRAADVAVDLSQFDIAHYLLSVMDHRRAAQKQASQQPQKSAVAQVPPVRPVAPPPVVAAPPPIVSPPIMSAPQPSGPNPFAVSTPPSMVVSLSKPQLRMAGAKPSAPTPAQAAPLATPALKPQSTLYIKPGGTPEVAREAAPAAAPVAAPIAAPIPASDPTPDQDQGWFSKMTSLFSSDDEPQASEMPQSVPVPVPESSPAPAEVAAIAVPTPTPAQTPSAPAHASNRISMQLTAALMLGKAPPPKPELVPASMRAPVDWPCVNKGQWGIVCLEPVRWPDEIAAYFITPNNTLYRGRNVIVAYEDDRADFFYAVFNSNGFKAVVDSFTQRLGPPDRTFNRQIKPFQKLLEVNPVRTWYATDPQTGREMILEISMFEDQSSTFPVMDEGAIKLTYAGEESVFRYTSPMELQRFN